MNRREWTTAIALGALIFGGLVQCGCAPAPTVPAYCTDEKLFTAALLRCVDKSADLPASRKCRADVHARCGITLTSSARSALP